MLFFNEPYNQKNLHVDAKKGIEESRGRAFGVPVGQAVIASPHHRGTLQCVNHVLRSFLLFVAMEILRHVSKSFCSWDNASSRTPWLPRSVSELTHFWALVL